MNTQNIEDTVKKIIQEDYTFKYVLNTCNTAAATATKEEQLIDCWCCWLAAAAVPAIPGRPSKKMISTVYTRDVLKHSSIQVEYL